MKIDQQHYDSVLSLATALTTAVENDNDTDYFYQYSQLETLCQHARKSDTLHPFLLESLGDFTLIDEEAIDIYQEALDLVEKLQLPEYCSSLQLAIAERYREIGDLDAALSYASEAQKNLSDASEQELREDIVAFVRSLRD
jgi:tetratricopeptide (TPR) repeat protein